MLLIRPASDAVLGNGHVAVGLFERKLQSQLIAQGVQQSGQLSRNFGRLVIAFADLTKLVNRVPKIRIAVLDLLKKGWIDHQRLV